MNKETTLCFTGHRPNKLFGYNPTTEGNLKMLKELREIIIFYIEKYEVDTFITGMALGIDMWSARIVLKLKEKYPQIKLVCAIPCDKQYSKWIDESVEEWKYIVSKADEVHYVSDKPYTNYCMQDRNKWMVDNSNYVIAVWDGSNGGTGNCVKYAKHRVEQIYKLNPKTLEQTYVY